jgi:uncharacterized secreted repeat protein (TIGR03808 family)
VATTRRGFLGASSFAAIGAWTACASLGVRGAAAQGLADTLRGALDAETAGLVPGSPDNQSAAFSQALASAAAESRPLFLPPGRYRVAGIALPQRAHLLGVPGESILDYAGGSFFLQSRGAAMLRLHGITLDGGGLPLDAPALLDVEDAADLVIDDSWLTNSSAAAVNLRASAGRVERSRFTHARTIGIDVDEARGMTVSGNVAADCGDTGILIERDTESADGTLVTGNRVERIRALSGGTGQYGNGINLDKANGVIVAGNRIDDCDFSAIRCFSSDDVALTGNIATNSGEMAFYVEFASEGSVVANNLIDGAAFGISLANFFEHGGRLATVSGNIVRNISGVSRLPRGAPIVGTGIAAEADVAISGNVVENAARGLALGWGPHLRDVSATGNTIRATEVGIAVSVVEGVGPALVANNLITGATRGAILGLRWDKIATGELIAGTEAAAFPWLTLAGNRAA